MKVDNEFISECKRQFPKMDSASRYYAHRGWEYYYQHDLNTAMKRFNQAWLLDSTNADCYWGFGIILGEQKQYKESIDLFEVALKFKPGEASIWQSAATSYGQYFFITKETKYLNTSIDYLKRSIALNPDDPKAYAQLTAAYTYFASKDSAKKYLSIADKIDTTLVSREVRDIITK